MALLLGTVVGWLVFEPVFALIGEPACNLPDVLQLNELAQAGTDNCRLLATGPFEPFSFRIKVSMLVGLIVAGPVLFYQLWRFVAPGLTVRERRLTLPFIASAQLMFMTGVVFAYFVIPQGLNIMLSFGGDMFVVALTGPEYLSFYLRTSLAVGVVFCVPVLLTFLSLVGVVSVEQLRRIRPYAIVVNAVVAAVVTPTPDPFNMLLLLVPMILFYELAIGAAWLIERSRRRRKDHTA